MTAAYEHPTGFTPCSECDYAVESSLAWCPNCGLYTSVEKTLIDTLLKREVERKRHPESLLSLEVKVKAEIQRLEGSLEHLQKTLEPLSRRVQDAREKGREPKGLLDAAAQIEVAVEEARVLLERHQAVLEGVALERRQNDLRLALKELESAELPPLTAEPEPEAVFSLPLGMDVRRLAFDADGTVWCLCKNHLVRWHPGEDRLAEEHRIPNGEAHAFDRIGEHVVVGATGGLHVLKRGKGWIHSVLCSRGSWGVRPTIVGVALSPEKDWILAGAREGGLYRFSTPANLDEFGPAEVERLSQAHGFGVVGVAIPANARALSAGTGRLKSWWVAGRSMTGFSEIEADQISEMAPGRGRILVARGAKVTMYDDNLSAQVGEFGVMGRILGLAEAPDRVRVMAWEAGGLWIGSPTTKNVFPLIRPAGRILAAAVDGPRHVVATDSAVTGPRLSVYDVEHCGLVGFTLSALARLTRYVDLAERTFPKEAHRRAAYAGALQGPIRDLLDDAASYVLTALTRRAELVERASRETPIPPSLVDHLAALFTELEDVAQAMEQASSISPRLRPRIDRLYRLPTALLLAQVDALLSRVEAVFRSVGTASEDDLDRALDELEALEAWAGQLERLGNGLRGAFWGTPDRARLIEAIESLREDFPSFIDGIHARIAAAALGRLDTLAEGAQLDALADQRRRIERISGGKPKDAALVLEEQVDGGPLGQEANQETRRARLESLERQRRELGAETEAYLETQNL